MKAQLKWTEGMKFEAATEGNTLNMDTKAPLGTGSAMSPKELVAVGLAGCTAMDVVALLKKNKQNYKTFDVDIDVTMSNAGHPIVFSNAILNFKATGDIAPNVFLDAVHLSQTKYCGVSAMLAKALPIHYVVTLNNEKIGEGKADFGGQNG
ncbi:MAG: hypothetical protein B7Y39_14310 [Bdellovibrio sp. 28-41-41]|nr:MAG: hypothetical protein B7Y39_14310 [Bdellovibrio sp. 28-41-41]